MQINYQTNKFHWTCHSKEKMRYYNLSESRLKRVLRHPSRVETGVAENTLAAMQMAGSKKYPFEIWLMYQIKNNETRIISAWRYPGVSQPGGKVPIPEDILVELGIDTEQ